MTYNNTKQYVFNKLIDVILKEFKQEHFHSEIVDKKMAELKALKLNRLSKKTLNK